MDGGGTAGAPVIPGLTGLVELGRTPAAITYHASDATGRLSLPIYFAAHDVELGFEPGKFAFHRAKLLGFGRRRHRSGLFAFGVELSDALIHLGQLLPGDQCLSY